MTRNDSPADAKAFHAALSQLVHDAHENGVSVAGGWECRNGPDTPNWEAIIVEVTSPTQQPVENDD